MPFEGLGAGYTAVAEKASETFHFRREVWMLRVNPATIAFSLIFYGSQWAPFTE